MNERTKNLLERKLLSGFLGLTAVLLSFSMVFAACDSPAGTDSDSGNSENVEIFPYDPSNPPPVTILESASWWDPPEPKKIQVEFKVQNGGWGLWGNEAVVSTEDDKYLERNGANCANDFSITLDKIHNGDAYLNIRWAGWYISNEYYVLKARLALPDDPGWTGGTRKFTVRIDFNHELFSSGWSIKTKNLYDIVTYKVKDAINDPDYGNARKNAKTD